MRRITRSRPYYNGETLTEPPTWTKHYDSYADMLDHIEQHTFTTNLRRASLDGSKSFCMTDTLEEAIALARTGWSEKCNAVEGIVGDLTTKFAHQVIPKTKYQWSVTGGSVNVGRALTGEPRSMRKKIRTMTEAQHQVIRIRVPLVYSAYNDVEDVVRAGITVTALAVLLTNAGYPVEIVGNYCNVGDYGKSQDTEIVLKPSDGVADIPNMLFAIAHPSSLRRVLFAECETYTDSQRKELNFYSGYGNIAKRMDNVDQYSLVIDNYNEIIHDPDTWLVRQLQTLGVLKEDDQ